MLDSCGQGPFMHEELVKELQLSERNTTLNLNGEKSESKNRYESTDMRAAGGNHNWI